jgi:glutamyl-tRNA synthetase
MSTENDKKVVTRFAPSPTGFMHIGGVRTALFAYLWARKNNGTFILRIEDTDKVREVAGSIGHIIKSLEWLGIEWDFGPDKPLAPFGSCIQSERLDTYKPWAEKLIAKGLAYPDPYTKEQVEEFRKQAEAEKRPFLFRNHRPEYLNNPENIPKWDGTSPLRFKVPEIKRYKWHDEVRGDLEAGEEALDDFILIKSDGYPTYNFAHIIDDHYMNVTHIMRADEFLSSTPKFLSLYDALELPWPKFVTMPPILRDDRTKKLGKRDGAKDILEYKDEGILPEAMLNFLALIGWNPGTDQEIFSKEELINIFDITRIQSGGGAFNEEKLHWMNKEYLKKMDCAEAEKIIIEKLVSLDSNFASKLKDKSFTDGVVKLVFERINMWSDIDELYRVGELDYFFKTPTYPKEMLYWKGDDTVKETLEKVLEIFSLANENDFNDSEKVKSMIWEYAESVGRGRVLWPLRVALSGKEKSPDPFTLASTFGKEETLLRVGKAIEMLG